MGKKFKASTCAFAFGIPGREKRDERNIRDCTYIASERSGNEYEDRVSIGTVCRPVGKYGLGKLFYLYLCCSLFVPGTVIVSVEE